MAVPCSHRWVLTGADELLGQVVLSIRCDYCESESVQSLDELITNGVGVFMPSRDWYAIDDEGNPRAPWAVPGVLRRLYGSQDVPPSATPDGPDGNAPEQP
jgi:hypothetical protein